MSVKVADCKAQFPDKCPYHGVYSAYDRAELAYMMDASSENLEALFTAREKVGEFEADDEAKQKALEFAAEYEQQNRPVMRFTDVVGVRENLTRWNESGDFHPFMEKVLRTDFYREVQLEEGLSVTKVGFRNNHGKEDDSYVLVRFSHGKEEYKVPYRTDSNGRFFLVSQESVTYVNRFPGTPTQSPLKSSLSDLMGG